MIASSMPSSECALHTHQHTWSGLALANMDDVAPLLPSHNHTPALEEGWAHSLQFHPVGDTYPLLLFILWVGVNLWQKRQSTPVPPIDKCQCLGFGLQHSRTKHRVSIKSPCVSFSFGKFNMPLQWVLLPALFFLKLKSTLPLILFLGCSWSLKTWWILCHKILFEQITITSKYYCLSRFQDHFTPTIHCNIFHLWFHWQWW